MPRPLGDPQLPIFKGSVCCPFQDVDPSTCLSCSGTWVDDEADSLLAIAYTASFLSVEPVGLAELRQGDSRCANGLGSVIRKRSAVMSRSGGAQ